MEVEGGGVAADAAAALTEQHLALLVVQGIDSVIAGYIPFSRAGWNYVDYIIMGISFDTYKISD